MILAIFSIGGFQLHALSDRGIFAILTGVMFLFHLWNTIFRTYFPGYVSVKIKTK